MTSSKRIHFRFANVVNGSPLTPSLFIFIILVFCQSDHNIIQDIFDRSRERHFFASNIQVCCWKKLVPKIGQSWWPLISVIWTCCHLCFGRRRRGKMPLFMPLCTENTLLFLLPVYHKSRPMAFNSDRRGIKSSWRIRMAPENAFDDGRRDQRRRRTERFKGALIIRRKRFEFRCSWCLTIPLIRSTSCPRNFAMQLAPKYSSVLFHMAHVSVETYRHRPHKRTNLY